MMPNNFDITCIGNAKIDAFLSIRDASSHVHLNRQTKELCIKSGEKIPVDSCSFLLGGNACNVAVSLSRLKLNTALMAEIGTDEFSQKIIKGLIAEKVNTDFVNQTINEQASFSVIINFQQERTIFTQHVIRKHNFNFDKLSTKWVYLTSLGNEWERPYTKTADFVKNNKSKLAFNPGTLQLDAGYERLKHILSLTNIIFINKEEAQILIGDNKQQEISNLLLQVKKLGPEIVVITDGENGSYLIDDKSKVHSQTIFKTKVVEKTGAGDAYASGFLAAIISGFSLKEGMSWGALNSSCVINKIGAQDGLLTKQEMQRRFRNSKIGYDKPLFILPFDHRSSFIKLFGFTNPELVLKEKETIYLAKEIIYEAFKKAVSEGVPKDKAAILVDEEYGDKIIKDAIGQKYNVILTTEKSGKKEFTFEYGDDFAEHIDKYHPNFVKALLRFPQEKKLEPNSQLEKLLILSDWCHQNGYKFLIEIVSSSEEKLDYKMVIGAIEQLQSLGIDPDVWKIEGMENSRDYESIVGKARINGREKVGIVILGKGEDAKQVEKWILAGAGVNGIIGFAIGRTVFWEPIVKFTKQELTRDETIDKISKNFQHFYKIFIDQRR